MKKVIYISFSRLIDRIARDWHIDFLLSKGVTVEYWDVVSLVREEHTDPWSIQPDYLRVLRSYEELGTALSRPDNRGAFFFVIVAANARFAKLYRMLSRHDCTFSYIAEGARPDIEKSTASKILDHLIHPFRLAKIVRDICLLAANRKLGLWKPFDTIFAAGGVMMSSDAYARKVVRINMMDYDHFTAAKNSETRFISERYAVYLDTNFVRHNDLAILRQPRMDADSYFNSMNRFFRHVERDHQLRVVIAAHPTADYSANPFEGRQCYRMRTAEIVRDAEFVISDCSTAIGYAVLNRKPIVFICTDEMLVLYKNTGMRLIRAFASFLQMPLCNIDALPPSASIELPAVIETRYNDYKYRYLTSKESEHTSTQEIIWSGLCEYWEAS